MMNWLGGVKWKKFCGLKRNKNVRELAALERGDSHLI